MPCSTPIRCSNPSWPPCLSSEQSMTMETRRSTACRRRPTTSSLVPPEGDHALSRASRGRRARERVLIGLIIACHMNLAGCSIFGGSSQPLLVNSDPPGANVLINGTSAGTTPLQYQVSRRGDLSLEVQKPGYTTQIRSTSRKLSSLGIVDVFGGAMFLLPLLGLFAPGAWEQDPSAFNLTLEPATNQPAQAQ